MKNFDLSVDLHAFSGTIEEAKKAVDLGYFLSFGPNLVFNKFRQQMLETIPLENILTETDSPVLGPKYGERNIPNNITLAIKKISEIKELTVNDSEKEVYTCGENQALIIDINGEPVKKAIKKSVIVAVKNSVRE